MLPEIPKMYDRLVCKDGESVSVQASRYSYSTPRDNSGPYTHVEAGFPSVNPPQSWMEFCEDSDRPTETVYGYMPIALVDEFVTAHGGLVDGEMPPRTSAALGQTEGSTK